MRKPRSRHQCLVRARLSEIQHVGRVANQAATVFRRHRRRPRDPTTIAAVVRRSDVGSGTGDTVMGAPEASKLQLRIVAGNPLVPVVWIVAYP